MKRFINRLADAILGPTPDPAARMTAQAIIWSGGLAPLFESAFSGQMVGRLIEVGLVLTGGPHQVRVYEDSDDLVRWARRVVAPEVFPELRDRDLDVDAREDLPISYHAGGTVVVPQGCVAWEEIVRDGGTPALVEAVLADGEVGPVAYAVGTLFSGRYHGPADTLFTPDSICLEVRAGGRATIMDLAEELLRRAALAAVMVRLDSTIKPAVEFVSHE